MLTFYDGNVSRQISIIRFKTTIWYRIFVIQCLLNKTKQYVQLYSQKKTVKTTIDYSICRRAPIPNRYLSYRMLKHDNISSLVELNQLQESRLYYTAVSSTCNA